MIHNLRKSTMQQSIQRTRNQCYEHSNCSSEYNRQGSPSNNSMQFEPKLTDILINKFSPWVSAGKRISFLKELNSSLEVANEDQIIDKMLKYLCDGGQNNKLQMVQKISGEQENEVYANLSQNIDIYKEIEKVNPGLNEIRTGNMEDLQKQLQQINNPLVKNSNAQSFVPIELSTNFTEKDAKEIEFEEESDEQMSSIQQNQGQQDFANKEDNMHCNYFKPTTIDFRNIRNYLEDDFEEQLIKRQTQPIFQQEFNPFQDLEYQNYQSQQFFGYN